MTGTATDTVLEHRIGPNGRFALRLPAGEVSVTAVDGDVARVRDLTGRGLAERFDISTGDDYLELVVRHKLNVNLSIGSFGFGSGAAELAIELPRNARVALEGASTDISVTGIRGPGRYRTASGDLILQDVGGNLDVEAVSGDLRVDAVAAIEVVGRTISGDAVFRAPRLTKFEFNTTSGDIRIDAELAGSGPWSVKSISGDVTLVARGPIQIEAQTVTGDLASDLQHKTVTGPGRRLMTVGGPGKPGVTFSFKSVSGDFLVMEPRDAGRPMPAGAADAAAAANAAAAPAPAMPAFAPETPRPAPPSEPTPESENARLEILRALERGEIDVETATERLAAVEEA
jgi:Putative adhesin